MGMTQVLFAALPYITSEHSPQRAVMQTALFCVHAAIALAYMHALETHVHQASSLDEYIYATHETSTRLIQATEVYGVNEAAATARQ